MKIMEFLIMVVQKIIRQLKYLNDIYTYYKMNDNFIVFDVETTGLPKSYNAPPILHHLWPHIVQFSWIINNNNKLEEKSYIIKPTNYIIPDDSIKIHGITNNEAFTNGVNIEFVLNLFREDCSKVDYLVAHNSSFDISVIYAACHRTNNSLCFEKDKKVICTMKSTTDLCKLKNPKYNNYKYPKLGELYEFLFNKKPNVKLHNSLEDSRITLLCYQYLHSQNFYNNVSH